MLVMLKNTINIPLKNKNKKLIKRSRIITQQPNNIGHQSIIDIKSGTIEHPNTSRELSKTIS